MVPGVGQSELELTRFWYPGERNGPYRTRIYLSL